MRGLSYDFLRPIDTVFSQFIYKKSGSELLANLSALVSYRLSEGHVCLDLHAIADDSFSVEGFEDELAFPSLLIMKSELELSPLVSEKRGETPLVLQGDMLYLEKYNSYEHAVCDEIASRLQVTQAAIDPSILQLAGMLFHTPDPGDLSDYGGHLQLAAGMVPLLQRVTIVSGGPGTGKTTVLSRILALLLTQKSNQHISLAAPTGKAAMRMNESLQGALENLNVRESVKQILQHLEAITIHRLLGSKRLSPHFVYNEKNQLPCDLLVVDEASMVDMALMAKLLRALKPESRVILLGDMNQLSSVEAGSVLGDICSAFGVNKFTDSFTTQINTIVQREENSIASSPESSPVVHLRRSYRFGPTSGIGNISRAIIEGNISLEEWESGYDDCTLESISDSEEYITTTIEKRYHPLDKATSPEEALAVLDQYKVLTATKVGPTGSIKINDMLSAKRAKAGEQWYENMPILIQENSYTLDLYNGDTGVIRRDESGTFKAYFRAGDTIRELLPALLPKYTLAYAITVHKSQGSEFDEVCTLLPTRDSSLLTKELIYTAITRAKKKAHTLYFDKELLQSWLERRVVRGSGLVNLLQEKR